MKVSFGGSRLGAFSCCGLMCCLGGEQTLSCWNLLGKVAAVLVLASQTWNAFQFSRLLADRIHLAVDIVTVSQRKCPSYPEPGLLTLPSCPSPPRPRIRAFPSCPS